VTNPADVAYGGHEEYGEHKMSEHRCPAIWRGERRIAGRCTWPLCKDANGICAYSPQSPPALAPSSPVNALVRLRAEMVRIANEVDALADLPSIREVRGHAPALGEKIRNVAMAADMVEASKHERS
jgi:hypothetical protein